MNSKNLNSLFIDSCLDDLPSTNSTVQHDTKGETVLQIFNQKPEDPGVIVVNNQKIMGVISREAFFENTGKRFGVEVFLGRPIYLMLENKSNKPLILPASSKISFAAHEALKREARFVYDPIVIEKSNQTYHLIDILTVFLAENKILLTLHNQNTYTVVAGLKIPDDEAILRFSKFANIPDSVDPLLFVLKHTVICDHCGQKIEYSITDIVRSHPQLDRGIEITTKMGNLTFTFYVRHTCGQVIREIPVLHDEEFKLRSLRPSRLVDSYV